MRQKFSYTDRQKEEMDLFFKNCQGLKIDFNCYGDVHYQAEQFFDEAPRSCSIPLLTLSAVIKYRGDKVEDIIKRKLESSARVRLKVMLDLEKKIKQGEINEQDDLEV